MVSLNPHTILALTEPLPKKGHAYWDSILKHHVKTKNDQAILKCYVEMEACGISPARSYLPTVIKACARQRDLELGKKIHHVIAGTNLMQDAKISTALVDFYCKCGLLDIALDIFDNLNWRDLISWNVLMWGYVDNCQYKEAIELFRQMEKVLKPSAVTLVGLISACTEAGLFHQGQEVHSYCLRNGFFHSDVHIGTSLIGFYSKFSLAYAVSVFDAMTIRNIASWNAILGSYLSWGCVLKSLDTFSRIVGYGIPLDSVTLLVTIQACAEFGSVDLGKQVHQFTIKLGFSSESFIQNALVNMYGKCNRVDLSQTVFEGMSNKDPASWNAMISAYRDRSCSCDTFDLFNRMRLQGIVHNVITICTLISDCIMANNLETGLQLHALCIKSGFNCDLSIGNALLGLYVNFNLIEHAHLIFSTILSPDDVSWNTMIMGLMQSQLQTQAFNLFKKMQQSKNKPNAFTLVSLLSGCIDNTFLLLGRSIHSQIIRRELEFISPIRTALANMYMNCGCESAASYLFWSSSDRDLISWNAMIASIARNGKPDKVLCLLSSMQSEMEPNSVTMITVLSSCADMANLPQAKCLHAYIIRRELDLSVDASLGNALLTMYAKCGSLKNALTIFNKLTNRDIVTWNAMIAAFGMHGRGNDALHLFWMMLEDGLKPTSVTLVSVLSACSHAGLIEEGWDMFHSMTSRYNILPDTVHYACMVDLLGRAGKLEEARELITSMPLEPDASVWRALLGACRVHNNTELAIIAAENLIKIEPQNIGNYILLSNIHAAAGNWEGVKKLRGCILERGLKKSPGKSWIVVRMHSHSFTAGDRLHPQADLIYSKLNWLLDGIGQIGYSPDLSWVLHNIEEEEKDCKLASHSEKLAISFGLLNISKGAPIMVNKNLRVCGDCHEFCKYVTKYVGREIILRDNTRFHHFSNGLCSCHDYW